MWWCFSALATTWSVPGDFPDLTTASSSLFVLDGDELLVASGTHAGVDLRTTPRNTLTIRGAGMGSTVLVGSGAPVVQTAGLTLNLVDLTVDGGNSVTGVRAEAGSTLNLSNVVIQNGSTSTAGGNLHAIGSTVTLTSVTVDSGNALNGGGIALEGSSALSASGLTAFGNQGSAGGGLFVGDGSSATLVGCTFFANDGQSGGGVHAAGTTDIEGCSFVANTANQGGGLQASGDATVTVSDSIFDGNSAVQNGGGLGGAGTFVLSTTHLSSNTAGVGAGVYLAGSGTSVLRNVSICQSASGHALYLSSGAADIANAVFLQTQAPVPALYSAGNLTIRNSTFQGNGGLWGLFSGGSLDARGNVFATTGLIANGGPNTAVANAFATASLIGNGVDPGQQLVGDPGLVGIGLCEPGVGFPYATSPALIDSLEVVSDTDGTTGDIGHLGGPEVDADYFAADGDGDGSLVHVDCDDSDASRTPGADELCDGVDNDCDGTVDEAGATVYLDLDGDGWGDDGTATEGCPGSGLVLTGGDCDDGDLDVNPGRISDATCDGVDDDCDGPIDEDAPTTTWYRDLDGDDFGDAGSPLDACSLPTGYVADSTDCDDSDASVNPVAPEQCGDIDHNCNGLAEDGVPTDPWYPDLDDDGFGAGAPVPDCEAPGPLYSLDGTDCDDLDATTNPSAPEQCDAIDHNCNGPTDDGVSETDWFLDQDDDGYGAGAAVSACAAPGPDYVGNATDCDDLDATTHPGAEEQCDAIDHNCNGPTEDGVPLLDWFLDIDDDGFGTGPAVPSCGPIPNHADQSGDCADGDPDIHPDADEVCDGFDNDCDGLIDDADAVPAPTVWFEDLDGDGYGVADSTVLQCEQPADTAATDGDCDDSNPNVYPGAPEACLDGLDNDCDLLVDTDDPDYSFDPVEYGNDADNDGYATSIGSVVACPGEQPLGYVTLAPGEDCDDALASVHPGAPELCDGLDNDCVDGVDNGLSFQDYFFDDDGDLFGDAASSSINACQAPPGMVGNNLDCDDGNPQRHPLIVEQCNAIDDDCDGAVDEDLDATVYFPDLDGDGYGDQDDPGEASCSPLDDRVLDNTDCDDADASIHPGAEDPPQDGIDADCDGTVEEVPPPELPDTDGDGVPDAIDGDPDHAGSPDTAPTPPIPEYGCGCSEAGGSGSWALLVALVAGFRRRRAC